MPHTNATVILNPAAGSVKDAELITTTIRERLPGAQIRVPSGRGDAGRLASEAVSAGCPLLIAAGGDGTLNEVINGLGGNFDRVRLGLLPLGTGNDFARTVAIPEPIEQALDILETGRTARIDLIRVTTSTVRHMINVSAGGFSAKVDEKMTPDVKETWGPLCYARSFIEALPELKDFQTEITLDDRERLDVPAYSVIVANARYVAHGIPIAPAALVDDGLADVIVLPVASVPQLAILAPATLLGRHLDSDQLIFRRARKIHVRSQPPMRFNTDGELLGKEPVTFEVLPGAIEFIVGDFAGGSR